MLSVFTISRTFSMNKCLSFEQYSILRERESQTGMQSWDRHVQLDFESYCLHFPGAFSFNPSIDNFLMETIKYNSAQQCKLS